MKVLFDFPVIYISYIMLGCVVRCGDANPVDTMTDLLAYSGWRALADPREEVEIVDPREVGETDHQVLAIDLVTTDVTEENVAEKIRLSHQFLSCSYARQLIDVCDYERGFGPQCRSMNTASESFVCMKRYLKVIRYKNPMVSRMIGALSSLHDLSPTQTQFRKAVFDVLVDMRSYYQHKTVVGPADNDDKTTRKIVDEECLDIEKQAHLMSKRLFAFYNRFCWPISLVVRFLHCSKATDHVNRLAEQAHRHGGRHCDRKDVCNTIENELYKISKKFTDTHDNRSGFEYEPESNTTRIITHDPDTAVRVTKMNQLLSNRKWWMWAGHFIIERGSDYRRDVHFFLEPDGNTIVTIENVYAKLKQAHQFLSCKYASVLIMCCVHTVNMWTKCQESQDEVCLNKFLQVLNEIDPSVVLMIDALSYLQKLSPHTVHNKVVYETLKRFRLFLAQRNAQPRNFRTVSSWSPVIVNDISEIKNATDEFCNEYCLPKYEFNAYYSGDNITIDVIGKTFKADVVEESKCAVFQYQDIGNLFQTL